MRFAAGALAGVSMLLAGCGSTQPASVSQDVANSPTASVRASEVAVSRHHWPAGGAEGEELRTAHHRVFTNVRNPVISTRLPVFMEDSLLHYRSAFSRSRPLPDPPRTLTSYVMATRGEWANLTAESLPPSRARRYLQIERGGFAENGIGYLFDIGTQDTFAVASHEGWHQYTQTTFAGRLPSWLEEGCATYCEGFRWSTTDRDRAIFSPWSNVERFDRLRDAHRVGSLLSLRELLSARPEVLLAGSADATLDYYAQLWALLHFLIEADDGRYADGLSRVLHDAADGSMAAAVRPRALAFGRAPSLGERVFTTYITPNIAEADAAYQAFVGRVVAPGSKQAIVAGRNPLGMP